MIAAFFSISDAPREALRPRFILKHNDGGLYRWGNGGIWV